MSKLSNSFWQSAIELQRYLDTENFDFCFIGGIAVQRWGEPRVTEDVDLTVVLPFGNERPFIDQMLKRYQSRHPDPVNFAVQARILLLADVHGMDIDLSLGGLPYEIRMLSRSSDWGTPLSGTIRTCSAEDLVILKSFAARPKDWIDVQNVIIRQGSKLGRELIRSELRPLAELKEEPEILSQLESLFEQH